VTCPDDNQAATSAVYAFRNLSPVDVVFSASYPLCSQWRGDGFPAKYNGTEIPVAQAGDPPVIMRLRPYYITNTPGIDMTKVQTVMTFRRLDGTQLGALMATMNWKAIPTTVTLEGRHGGEPVLRGQPDMPIRVSVSPMEKTARSTHQFTFTLRREP